MSATTELQERVRFLRNAAPQEFDAFRAAFANYTRSSFDVLVHAAGDTKLVQGHAQQCIKILRLLEEIRDG